MEWVEENNYWNIVSEYVQTLTAYYPDGIDWQPEDLHEELVECEDPNADNWGLLTDICNQMRRYSNEVC